MICALAVAAAVHSILPRAIGDRPVRLCTTSCMPMRVHAHLCHVNSAETQTHVHIIYQATHLHATAALHASLLIYIPAGSSRGQLQYTVAHDNGEPLVLNIM